MVYLIHGINLKPERMAELEGFLSQDTEIIALPGHKGDSTRNVTKEILLEYVDKKIATDNCAIVGFSLGGLIATKLAIKRNFKKVCLIAPAIYPRGLKLYLPISRVLSKVPIPLPTLSPKFYSQSRFVYPNLFNALFELAAEVYSSKLHINTQGKVFFHPKDRLVDVKRSASWINQNTTWDVELLPEDRCLFNHMLISEQSYKGFEGLGTKVRDFLDS